MLQVHHAYFCLVALSSLELRGKPTTANATLVYHMDLSQTRTHAWAVGEQLHRILGQGLEDGENLGVCRTPERGPLFTKLKIVHHLAMEVQYSTVQLIVVLRT